MDTFLSQIFLSHWLILMGTFLCVGFFFFFVIFVNICICASAIYTMGEKRVENVCMYIFLQINLCRQKSCFDHAQHADKSSQNDWRENSKQIFQIHTVCELSEECEAIEYSQIPQKSVVTCWTSICGHGTSVCVSLVSILLHFTKSIWSKFARPLNGIDMSWLLFIIQKLFLNFPKTYYKTQIWK